MTPSPSPQRPPADDDAGRGLLKWLRVELENMRRLYRYQPDAEVLEEAAAWIESRLAQSETPADDDVGRESRFPDWNDLPEAARVKACEAARLNDPDYGGQTALDVYNAIKDNTPPDVFPLFSRLTQSETQAGAACSVLVTPDIVEKVFASRCRGCSNFPYEECPRHPDKACFREFHGGSRAALSQTTRSEDGA